MTRCGTVGFVGRPNTGKSSLLNRLVGEKISIVSAKPQTTRHLVTGILTRGRCQYVFVDAPGAPPRMKSVLHRALNRRVNEAARDVDVVLFVVEAGRFGPEDRAALERIQAEGGLARRLVGLTSDSRRVPRQGYEVFAGDREVGRILSGAASPTLQTNIATTYLPVDLAEPGTEVEFAIRGKREPAVVAPLPFYKRSR